MATHERIRRYRKVALWIGIILATIWGLSWGLGREQWGPFRGQIVDVETGKPVEGAAVLVVWLKDIPMPVHSVTGFYDAREAVTDVEGRFVVPRIFPALFWLFVRKPQFHYFAPGYVPQSVFVSEGKTWVEHKVVEMRRLKSREELLKKRRSSPALVPLDKMTEFTKAVNVERKMLGFD